MITAGSARKTVRDGEDLLVGAWRVSPKVGIVTSNGVERHLEPKAVEVLLCLANRAGEVISKNELVETVWVDTFVSDDVLAHCIWQLRQIFGKAGAIQTVPRRGYRLVLPVRALERIRSLAVLPLVDLAADAEKEYFVDGMTELIITELAQIAGLRVISRTSSARYRRAQKSIKEIAQELDVEAILEGSVIRTDGHWRMCLQLINARHDSHLWAKTYDFTIQELGGLQRDVARCIARELYLDGGTNDVLHRPLPARVVPEAYEAYLKGRYCWNRASPESTQRSVAYFRDAIRKDPHFALAYTGLADVYSTMASPILAAVPSGEAMAVIRPAVRTAFELSPRLADAHAALAWCKHYYEWDWCGAEVSYDRAIELNPNCSIAYAGRGILLGGLGRNEDSLTPIRVACKLDPLSLMWNTLLSWSYLLAGEPEAGIEHLRSTMELDPQFWFGHQVLGLCLLFAERHAEAIATLETAVRFAGEVVVPKGMLGYAYGVTGKQERSRQIIRELEASDRYVPPTVLAFIYKGIGDKDKAFHFLETGFQLRDTAMIWMKVLWSDWCTDPRYVELVRRMNLAE